MDENLSYQEAAPMLQEALDNWNFDACDDPEDGEDQRAGLLWLQQHPDSYGPPYPKDTADWEGLSRLALEVGRWLRQQRHDPFTGERRW